MSRLHIAKREWQSSSTKAHRGKDGKNSMPASIYARPARLSSTFRNTEYLKPGDLALLLPFSRGTIDRMIDAGELPEPDIIRPCLRLWRKDTMLPAIRRVLGVEVDQ